MATNIQYKISLAVSTALSLLFILLLVLATINGASTNDTTLLIVIVIGGSYFAFLLFNIQCYAILKANRENKPLPTSVQQYGTLLYVFTIIGIVIIALMFVAATFSLVASTREFPREQLPYYIFFLVLLLMSVISCIQNTRIYRKEKRRNSSIVNSLINDIGSGM